METQYHVLQIEGYLKKVKNKTKQPTKKLAYFARHCCLLNEGYEPETCFSFVKKWELQALEFEGGGKGLSPNQDFLFDGITVIENRIEKGLAHDLMLRLPSPQHRSLSAGGVVISHRG